MKTLQQVLEDRTDEQFTAILRLWVMTGEPDRRTKQQIDALIKRMQNPIAARFVWEKLTDDERQLLYRALQPSTRYYVSSQNLLKSTKLSSTRYETALSHLVEYALLQTSADYSARRLVNAATTTTTQSLRFADTTTIATFGENADILYSVSREFFTPSGDRSKWDLVRLLDALPANALYAFMENYDVPQKKAAYYSQYDDADIVADHLINMGEPLDYLPNLEPKPRELFVWLRNHQGKASIQAVRDFMKGDDAALLATLHTLALHGLVFDSFSKGELVVFVPGDLYGNMNPLPPNSTHMAEDEPKVTTLANDPAAIRAGESIAVYDIATLVNTIYQQTIEPTQAGRVPKRIAIKIRATLRGLPRLDYDDSDEYIEILLNVMEYFNIIQLTNPSFQDIKPAYEISPAINTWAQKSLLHQTHALIRYWMENFAWRDVYGANYRSWSTYSWDVSGGRKALIKHLYNYTSRHWYSIDTLLQEIWREDGFAYRPATSSYGRSAKARRDADTKAKWDLCEGEVYRGILSSTLRELGIVDIGYKHPDALSSTLPVNPDYFMLTELGHKVMALGTPGLESQTLEEQLALRGLVVQPNFELLLLQPDLATLYTLLPFAQANQLGLVSRLTLTKASVLRGLQSGQNVEQILHTLREHSQKELPQNVEYTVRDWTKTFKSAKLSQVLLFEVSSEEAGQILTVLPALQELGVRQLVPCIFAVSGSVNLQAVRKELEKAGVFVHISGEIFSRPKNPFESYITYGRY